MGRDAMLAFIKELPSAPAFPRLDSRSSRQTSLLPDCAAVYFVLSANEKVLYIGATKSLKTRWLQHHWRTKIQEYDPERIRVAWISIDLDCLTTVEHQFIRKLQPPLNVNCQRYPNLN